MEIIIGIIIGLVVAAVITLAVKVFGSMNDVHYDPADELHYAARQADKLFRRATVRMDDAAAEDRIGRHRQAGEWPAAS